MKKKIAWMLDRVIGVFLALLVSNILAAAAMPVIMVIFSAVVVVINAVLLAIGIVLFVVIAFGPLWGPVAILYEDEW